MDQEGKRLTRHHRKCKSRGGNGKPANITMVEERLHKAFHLLFSNMDAYQIAQQLNSFWLDPDYHVEVKRRWQ